MMPQNTTLPDLPAGYDLSIGQTGAFLVNVAVQMYEDWKTDGRPERSDFNWTPSTHCPVFAESPFEVGQFTFISQVWSQFETDLGESKVEPFGFLAVQQSGGLNVLAIRGTETVLDWVADAEFSLVDFAYGAGKVEKGFNAVFEGMIPDLSAILSDLSAKSLVVSGHSLGSSLTTLIGPYAVQEHGIGVANYNTASPLTGDQAFATFTEGLSGLSTFRLVNLDDIVPRLPPEELGFVHVGPAAQFSESHGSTELERIADNHSGCCTYAYAIMNPAAYINPDFDSCMNSQRSTEYA